MLPKKVKAEIVMWVMRRRVYHYALKHVIPYIRFSTYYTSLRGWKYQVGYALLQPGDFILTIDKKKLTTFLIPGEFSHAAFCRSKGSDGDWEISEMTHSDFTKSYFFDICKESDRVVICRCPDWDGEYLDKMIERDMSFSDQPYDNMFDLKSDALSCSEHIYKLDPENRLKVSTADVIGIGSQYVSPTGLWNAENKIVVWDSDDCDPPLYFPN
ncbi:YiiX/YebB-like N1pC/P60 family cysteine hydrolase [Limibacter armeniacum]|uniref:YiiX/YebB-like N1pC/P60 family cysteine hydrolase n=1 Tax=Limibacter armeniacum TaxID=466084 RepID=UPI002FE6401B